MKRIFKPIHNRTSVIKVSLASAVVLLISGTSAPCAVVSEKEALATADFWQAKELNSGHVKIDAKEKALRLGNIAHHQVLYLVSENSLLDAPPANGEVLAYVVKYDPTGFVVVSGDDTIEPITVFSTESQFRWDMSERPERNFLRKYLGKSTTARRAYALAQGKSVTVHPNWSNLRSQLLGSSQPLDVQSDGPSPKDSAIYVKYDTALWNQWDFYNAVVINHVGGNWVPTGCVATALAITLRFHQWPVTGSGIHDYCDRWGDLQYCQHNVDFSAEHFNWGAMPSGVLRSNNLDIAQLIYLCGVAVDMNYEPGFSGTFLEKISAYGNPPGADALFRYRGTEYWPGTNQLSRVIESIRAGLPVLAGGSGHCWVIDGYRNTGATFFSCNIGYDGANNGWYNLDDAAGHVVVEVLPYLSPDNYRFIDGVLRFGSTGTAQNAFPDLSQGVVYVPTGGQLWLKAGTYTGIVNVPITISKPMTLKAYYQGSATIGP